MSGRVDRLKRTKWIIIPFFSTYQPATDDFRVTAVLVEIYDAAGTLHETGSATQNKNGLDWTYTTQLNNSLPAGSRIKATATDVTGNEGSLEMMMKAEE